MDTYRSIVHGDIRHEDVLHNVDFALVLAQGSDRDPVRAVAVQVLHDDIGAVGFERDAI